MTQTKSVARITGLKKSYGEVRALAGVDLEIQAGEIVGLLGPNGAGKSTTIKTLATLLKPDGGKVTVLGHDVVDDASKARAVLGYVPQELTSDKTLTGRENLRLFCRLYHVEPAAMSERIQGLLELVDLTEAADRQVRTYSGGMRKRLDLVCGLVHSPALLILDEPSLGLDVQARRIVWDHIKELSRAGMAVFIATNSMEEAEALCHRVAIIDRGRVVTQGKPDALKGELGGDMVTLTFDTENPMPADLAAKLQGLRVVKRMTLGDDRVDLRVSANEQALAAVLQAARVVGAKPATASYSRPSLEAVFLESTGHRFDELPEATA